jgi:hypothetical protein
MSHLIDDIADYLEDQELGTVGTDIYAGYLPDYPDSCITVLDTGGSPPDPDLPTKEPTFQVFIRDVNYSDGKTALDSVRSVLHQQANIQLVDGGNYFYFILAISEGGHVGRDEVGRDLFSINFQCRTR